MRIIIRLIFYVSLLLAALPSAAATKIAGITLSETYQIGEESLQLNGAGIRSKLFVKVYVGALYLGRVSGDSAAILEAPGAKSMQMTMLYKEVEADKITSGWREGFEANLTAAELQSVAARLQEFNSLFPSLHKGDIVRMDYQPGTGTLLSINGEQLGRIEGADFFEALLKVWIGDKPADSDLKKGLLGKR